MSVELLRKALDAQKQLGASLAAQLDPRNSPHPSSRRLDLYA
jgi:hypothetical protein